MTNKSTHHVGDCVLVSDALGASAWEGVVVETADSGIRVKVQPMKRLSFWHKPSAVWITAWSHVVPIDSREETP